MLDVTTKPVTVPLEETTPIKPSEALRLGRLTRPRHARGDMFEGDDGACAVGAIAEGWGLNEQDGYMRLLGMGVHPFSDLAADYDARVLREHPDPDADAIAFLEERGL